MDNRKALDPRQSVVVEACAGSGKTWLLVSRIVRLLLDGVEPSDILAITFTRRAAQEMQARLRDWLYELASKDDDCVRDFLREREIDDAELEIMLPRARRLYQQFLLAQPSITISTFHGWFMQILQRAPLNAGVPVGMQLLERTASLRDEAWQEFVGSLRAATHEQTEQYMQQLFAEYGLHNTRTLLENFVHKRAEWWACSQGQNDAAAWATGRLQSEFGIEDIDFDPVEDWGMCGNSEELLFAFTRQLACNGSAAQQRNAGEIEFSWTDNAEGARFDALWPLLFTQAGKPRTTFKPNTKQNADVFLHTRDALQASLQSARDEFADIAALRMNRAVLHCGVALLDTYQALKQRQQLLDFTDLEWQVCRMLNDSDCAEYMQYKLDSRYRHVLLDEFQDTNPLQWQILQSWFSASKAVDSTPVVFVVGDPKQSIYRFRRADARLFDVVRKYLVQQYSAVHLKKNETRRNAPAVLDAVNAVFDGLKEYEGFEKHTAHQKSLAGRFEVLPLSSVCPAGLVVPEVKAATATSTEGRDQREKDGSNVIKLRNPLTEAYPDAEEGAREAEAEQLAARIAAGNWQIVDEGKQRLAEFSDIMVLVRRRTHLKVYEEALRRHCIPYLTSRRGGLLDTLEASDIQALLNFLITPFDDLALTHTLRTPMFSCSDDDLMEIAGCRMQNAADKMELNPESRILYPDNWWLCVKQLVAEEAASPRLQRAHELLQGWMLLADKLPVHDLLDRIYFEADVKHRYAAAVPGVMAATVLANLQAFLEIALNVDAGRYPSLPGFLRELAELRKAPDNESPDEGRVAHAGNAIRIYTVHEAKGLEAPVVWLLDANAKAPADKGYEVLVDWPTDAPVPAHFSLYADKASRGAVRGHYFEQEEKLAAREDLNLLYVAMTRAKQFLIVSGNGALAEGSWYDRIAGAEIARGFPAQPEDDVPGCCVKGRTLGGRAAVAEPQSSVLSVAVVVPATDTARPASCGRNPEFTIHNPLLPELTLPLPTGRRRPPLTEQQNEGIWLHGLLQKLAPSSLIPDQTTSHSTKPASGQVVGYPLQAGKGGALQRNPNIPAEQMPLLMQKAQEILGAPDLVRFFDARCFLTASNELSYVNAAGGLRRIDRLVEFEHEVWVLDYKTGMASESHAPQLQEYRSAMQTIYPGKTIRCGLIFAGGKFLEA